MVEAGRWWLDWTRAVTAIADTLEHLLDAVDRLELPEPVADPVRRRAP